MSRELAVRRLSGAFLFLLPFLTIAVVAPRALRVVGAYGPVGVLIAACVGAAVWIQVVGPGSAWPHVDGRLTLSGGLLVSPWALVALLWVGLGTPWDSTPSENVMRYGVLLTAAVVVTGGFVLLAEALRDAGERLCAPLGSTAALLSGAAYLMWATMELSGWVARVRDGRPSPAAASMSDVRDGLLFSACLLTYVATAAFAWALGRRHLLGRRAVAAFVGVNGVALLLLLLRGLAFPDPFASTTPWYVRPGFVAGIPAVPWIMPALLGVVLLRRGAHPDQRATSKKPYDTSLSFRPVSEDAAGSPSVSSA